MNNNLDIEMMQGSSLTYNFKLKQENGEPYVLTDIDARLQVRASYGATTPLINCTLANGKLVLTSAALGILSLVLAPEDTSPIRFAQKDDESFKMVYDLEIVSPSAKVYKPATGTLTINREVTR